MVFIAALMFSALTFAWFTLHPEALLDRLAAFLRQYRIHQR